MKIEVNEDHGITLKEVFNGVTLETDEGEQLGVCMRDGGFELCVATKGRGRTKIRTRYSILYGEIKKL